MEAEILYSRLSEPSLWPSALGSVGRKAPARRDVTMPRCTMALDLSRTVQLDLPTLRSQQKFWLRQEIRLAATPPERLKSGADAELTSGTSSPRRDFRPTSLVFFTRC